MCLHTTWIFKIYWSGYLQPVHGINGVSTAKLRCKYLPINGGFEKGRKRECNGDRENKPYDLPIYMYIHRKASILLI